MSAEVVASTAAPVLTHDEALSRARAMVPRLKERAPLADSLRRCPDESVRELIESGLMRLLQPRRVGGSELPWVALIDIGSELARGCGSTAWNWANYAVHHWMLAFWPVACQDEIWGADRDVLIASSMVFPAGKARRVAGGYRLSGRWPFSSGVDPSAWNMLGGIVRGEADTGEYRMFLLPLEDYTVIDNWHVMGLRGTGSKDVEAKDVFVPEDRTVAVEATKGGDNHPGRRGQSRAAIPDSDLRDFSLHADRHRARHRAGRLRERHRRLARAPCALLRQEPRRHDGGADQDRRGGRMYRHRATGDARSLPDRPDAGRARRSARSPAQGDLAARRRIHGGSCANAPSTCCSRSAAAARCSTTIRCSAHFATCTPRPRTSR